MSNRAIVANTKADLRSVGEHYAVPGRARSRRSLRGLESTASRGRPASTSRPRNARQHATRRAQHLRSEPPMRRFARSFAAAAIGLAVVTGSSARAAGDATHDKSLQAISCVGGSFCLAVGDLSARWNGHTWSSSSLASGLLLDSVSCNSTTTCVAVGTASANGSHGARRSGGTGRTGRGSANPPARGSMRCPARRRGGAWQRANRLPGRTIPLGRRGLVGRSLASDRRPRGTGRLEQRVATAIVREPGRRFGTRRLQSRRRRIVRTHRGENSTMKHRTRKATAAAVAGGVLWVALAGAAIAAAPVHGGTYRDLLGRREGVPSHR